MVVPISFNLQNREPFLRIIIVPLGDFARPLSISSQIVNFAIGLAQRSGYSGVFALMILESATLPVPSEVVLPVTGYLVHQGELNFWVAVLVASVGSLIGTSIDYYIGYYLGRDVVLHYGRKIRLNEDHLRTTERWFSKYGNATVLFARFVPLIRTLVAFPAGVAKMRMWKFLAFSTIGIVVWDAILIYVGYVFGESIIGSLEGAFGPIEIVALIVAIVVLAIWIRRRKPEPAPREPATSK
jgi:membrane protein DedA with SNARE-associated domain